MDEFGSRLWKTTVIANLTNKKKMLQRSTMIRKSTIFLTVEGKKKWWSCSSPWGELSGENEIFLKEQDEKKGTLPDISLKRWSVNLSIPTGNKNLSIRKVITCQIFPKSGQCTDLPHSSPSWGVWLEFAGWSPFTIKYYIKVTSSQLLIFCLQVSLLEDTAERITENKRRSMSWL